MAPMRNILPTQSIFAFLLTIGACNFCAGAGIFDWRDTHFPSNANVLTLKPSGTALFAGTETGRIYRSTDEGAHWSKVLDANSSASYRAPVQDFLFSDSIYLAAVGPMVDLQSWDCFSPECIPPRQIGNLYRSVDRGLSWSPTPIQAATALATGGGFWFSAHLEGISRSRDQGFTWTALTLQSDPQLAVALPTRVAIKNLIWFNKSLYARTSEGLMAGALKGDTLIFKKSLPDAQCVLAVGASLLASTKTGFYRSRDGETWERLSQRGFSSLIASGNKILGLPIESGILQASADTGKTWTPAAGATATTITSVCVQGTQLFVGQYQKGVYTAKAGNQGWAASGTGLYDYAVTGILQRGFDNYRVVTLLSSGKMRQAQNSIAGLYDPMLDVGSSIKQMEMDGEDAFGLSDGALLTSLGIRRDVWDTLAPCNNCSGMVVGKGWQAAFQRDNSLLLCEGGSHCETLPRNRLPEPQSLQSSTGILLTNRFQSASVSGDSILLALDSLYRSSDRGRTWMLMGPLPGTRPLIKCLYKVWFMAVSKAGKATVLASHDGGQTWQQSLPDGLGFEINSMSEIRFAYEWYADSNVIYFGTNKGLQYFSIAENKWKNLGPQLANANVTALSVSDNVLLAGLESGEVMELYLYVVGIRSSNQGARTSLRLRANPLPGRFLDHGRLKGLDGRLISSRSPF